MRGVKGSLREWEGSMRELEGSINGKEGSIPGNYQGDKMHPNSNVFFLTAVLYIKPVGAYKTGYI